MRQTPGDAVGETETESGGERASVDETWRPVGRLLAPVAVAALGTTAVFFLFHVGPVDPVAAVLGPNGSEAQALRLRGRLGLDDPLWMQYRGFVTGAFGLHDGESLVVAPGTPVSELVLAAVPQTLGLAFAALAVGIGCGLPLGTLAGRRSGPRTDALVGLAGRVRQAVPVALLAVAAVAALSAFRPAAVGVGWTDWPVGSLAAASATTLGLATAGTWMRAENWEHRMASTAVREGALLCVGAVVLEGALSLGGLGGLFAVAAVQGDVALVEALLSLAVSLPAGAALLGELWRVGRDAHTPPTPRSDAETAGDRADEPRT